MSVYNWVYDGGNQASTGHSVMLDDGCYGCNMPTGPYHADGYDMYTASVAVIDGGLMKDGGEWIQGSLNGR